MHLTIDADGNAKNRKADIMADAAYVILNQPSKLYTGNFAIDEVVLRFQGITDFQKYKVDPKCPDDRITMDFFLPENPYHNAIVPPKIIKAKL